MLFGMEYLPDWFWWVAIFWVLGFIGFSWLWMNR
ncbi:hypothetical protein JOC86_000093 [Bacillus pakistanensis]|uniref:ATP synthase F0 subunit 8 n=1 Tax=Rossellomorea pakistanensis TaxID=992288 RepID=A0ABS2N7I5_9BACI|nr:hypothetical protein [Bacillus pakistanensis]